MYDVFWISLIILPTCSMNPETAIIMHLINQVVFVVEKVSITLLPRPPPFLFFFGWQIDQWCSEGWVWLGMCLAKAPCSSHSCQAFSCETRERRDNGLEYSRCPANANDLPTPLRWMHNIVVMNDIWTVRGHE